jgi:hypothetical protein
MDVMPRLNPPRAEGLANAQPSRKQNAGNNKGILNSEADVPSKPHYKNECRCQTKKA